MTSHAGNKKLLVVVGATGNQGNPVARWFATSSSAQDFSVRGITRNTSSHASKQLSKVGVEMVEADLSDLTSFKAAFAGATHIFANTDSNQSILQAFQNPSILSEGQSPSDYAHDVELAHGTTIAEAAAATRTLERLVWSNISSPKKWSKGKYSKVSMWDVKEEIAYVLDSKPELKGKVSSLFVGIYASMPLHMPLMYAPKKQPDGSYEFAIHMSGEIKLPLADLDVDMGPWVNALFQSEPGTSLIGATESITWKEWLLKWAERNGVEARFRRSSYEEVAAKFSGFNDALLEVAGFLEDYGFTGGNPGVVLPDDLRRRGIDIGPSNIDEHIRRTDWSSIL